MRKHPHLRLVTDDDRPAEDPCDGCPRRLAEVERLAALHLAARRGVDIILNGLIAADT